MSTAVAVQQHTNGHVPALGTITPSQPVSYDWDREMRGAAMLRRSGLCPQGLKSDEAVLFVILAGRDLGLSPVQSLRSINVIQGKVEVSADMQLGLFHRAGGTSKWTELTNDRAVLWLNAPWLAAPHTETFTTEDAKRAGLSGDNWRKYPKAMLRSRAITAGMKSIGFDALAGVYSEGEIGGAEPRITEEPETVEAVVGTIAPSAAPAAESADPLAELRARYMTLVRDTVAGADDREQMLEWAHRPDTTAEQLSGEIFMLEEVVGQPAAAAPTQPEPPTGPNAPSEKQVAFFTRLVESPVITADERAKALAWLPNATRATMTRQLDKLKTMVETRKAS